MADEVFVVSRGILIKTQVLKSFLDWDLAK